MLTSWWSLSVGASLVRAPASSTISTEAGTRAEFTVRSPMQDKGTCLAFRLPSRRPLWQGRRHLASSVSAQLLQPSPWQSFRPFPIGSLLVEVSPTAVAGLAAFQVSRPTTAPQPDGGFPH